MKSAWKLAWKLLSAPALLGILALTPAAAAPGWQSQVEAGLLPLLVFAGFHLGGLIAPRLRRALSAAEPWPVVYTLFQLQFLVGLLLIGVAALIVCLFGSGLAGTPVLAVLLLVALGAGAAWGQDRLVVTAVELSVLTSALVLALVEFTNNGSMLGSATALEMVAAVMAAFSLSRISEFHLAQRGKRTFLISLGVLGAYGGIAVATCIFFAWGQAPARSGLIALTALLAAMLSLDYPPEGSQLAPRRALPLKERSMPALGFRGFKLQEVELANGASIERRWLLTSLSGRGPAQMGRVVHARCADGCERVPSDDHDCGVYALGALEAVGDWEFHLNSCTHCVVAAVRGYGELVEHREGFRASEVEIIGLLDRGRLDLAAEVAEQLGVPCMGRQALLAYCSEQATRLRS